METINIKDICPTVEAAIRAMVAGIKTQAKRKDFNINMDSFGGFNGSTLCYGCAATCTIQEITHINLTPSTIVPGSTRAEALSFDRHQLSKFERAIDGMRQGFPAELIRFYHSEEWESLMDKLKSRMNKANCDFCLWTIDLSSLDSSIPEQVEEYLTKLLAPFEWLADQCKQLNL
jgi:hypothetical protein